jgi:hypothetical protein
MNPLTSKRFNERALLTLHHINSESTTWGICYCRPVKTFVYQGIRFYHVKPCDSAFGKIQDNAPTYSVTFAQLQDTRRRFGKDGKERKRR